MEEMYGVADCAVMGSRTKVKNEQNLYFASQRLFELWHGFLREVQGPKSQCSILYSCRGVTS